MKSLMQFIRESKEKRAPRTFKHRNRYMFESYWSDNMTDTDKEHMANFISSKNAYGKVHKELFEFLDVVTMKNKEFGRTPEKIGVKKQKNGFWRLWFDGNDTGFSISGDRLSEDSARKLGWLKS